MEHARKGWLWRKWVITTVLQGSNAPLMDACRCRTDCGKTAEGFAIVPPWKLRISGRRLRTPQPTNAIVIARAGKWADRGRWPLMRKFRRRRHQSINAWDGEERVF